MHPHQHLLLGLGLTLVFLVPVSCYAQAAPSGPNATNATIASANALRISGKASEAKAAIGTALAATTLARIDRAALLATMADLGIATKDDAAVIKAGVELRDDAQAPIAVRRDVSEKLAKYFFARGDLDRAKNWALSATLFCSRDQGLTAITPMVLGDTQLSDEQCEDALNATTKRSGSSRGKESRSIYEQIGLGIPFIVGFGIFIYFAAKFEKRPACCASAGRAAHARYEIEPCGIPPPTLEEHEGRLFPPEQFPFTRGGMSLASLFFRRREIFASRLQPVARRSGRSHNCSIL